jgi:hypothetical protein
MAAFPSKSMKSMDNFSVVLSLFTPLQPRIISTNSALLRGLLDNEHTMCKATIEANAANQSKYGVGLNTGILYLMCVPYIAAAVLGYLWYRNAKVKGSLPKFR